MCLCMEVYVADEFVFTSPALPCKRFLFWIVCEMGGKWPCNYCFVGYCFQDLFKTTFSILVSFLSSFRGLPWGDGTILIETGTDSEREWKESVQSVCLDENDEDYQTNLSYVSFLSWFEEGGLIIPMFKTLTLTSWVKFSDLTIDLSLLTYESCIHAVYHYVLVM